MQVSGAPAAQVTAKLVDDTMERRRWPGQGALPVTDFIRVVHAKGGLKAMGQEVFSLEADAMSPEQAGRVAGEATWAAFRHSAHLRRGSGCRGACGGDRRQGWTPPH